MDFNCSQLISDLKKETETKERTLLYMAPKLRELKKIKTQYEKLSLKYKKYKKDTEIIRLDSQKVQNNLLNCLKKYMPLEKELKATREQNEQLKITYEENEAKLNGYLKDQILFKTQTEDLKLCKQVKSELQVKVKELESDLKNIKEECEKLQLKNSELETEREQLLASICKSSDNSSSPSNIVVNVTKIDDKSDKQIQVCENDFLSLQGAQNKRKAKRSSKIDKTNAEVSLPMIEDCAQIENPEKVKKLQSNLNKDLRVNKKPLKTNPYSKNKIRKVKLKNPELIKAKRKLLSVRNRKYKTIIYSNALKQKYDKLKRTKSFIKLKKLLKNRIALIQSLIDKCNNLELTLKDKWNVKIQKDNLSKPKCIKTFTNLPAKKVPFRITDRLLTKLNNDLSVVEKGFQQLWSFQDVKNESISNPASIKACQSPVESEEILKFKLNFSQFDESNEIEHILNENRIPDLISPWDSSDSETSELPPCAINSFNVSCGLDTIIPSFTEAFTQTDIIEVKQSAMVDRCVGNQQAVTVECGVGDQSVLDSCSCKWRTDQINAIKLELLQPSTKKTQMKRNRSRTFERRKRRKSICLNVNSKKGHKSRDRSMPATLKTFTSTWFVENTSESIDILNTSSGLFSKVDILKSPQQTPKTKNSSMQTEKDILETAEKHIQTGKDILKTAEKHIQTENEQEYSLPHFPSNKCDHSNLNVDKTESSNDREGVTNYVIINSSDFKFKDSHLKKIHRLTRKVNELTKVVTKTNKVKKQTYKKRKRTISSSSSDSDEDSVIKNSKKAKPISSDDESVESFVIEKKTKTRKINNVSSRVMNSLKFSDDEQVVSSTAKDTNDENMLSLQNKTKNSKFSQTPELTENVVTSGTSVECKKSDGTKKKNRKLVKTEQAETSCEPSRRITRSQSQKLNRSMESVTNDSQTSINEDSYTKKTCAAVKKNIFKGNKENQISNKQNTVIDELSLSDVSDYSIEKTFNKKKNTSKKVKNIAGMQCQNKDIKDLSVSKNTKLDSKVESNILVGKKINKLWIEDDDLSSISSISIAPSDGKVSDNFKEKTKIVERKNKRKLPQTESVNKSKKSLIEKDSKKMAVDLKNETKKKLEYLFGTDISESDSDHSIYSSTPKKSAMEVNNTVVSNAVEKCELVQENNNSTKAKRQKLLIKDTDKKLVLSEIDVSKPQNNKKELKKSKIDNINNKLTKVVNGIVENSILCNESVKEKTTNISEENKLNIEARQRALAILMKEPQKSCLPVKTAFKRPSRLKNTEPKKSANENCLLEWGKGLKNNQNKNKSINAPIVLSKQNNTDSINEQETENTSSSRQKNSLENMSVLCNESVKEKTNSISEENELNIEARQKALAALMKEPKKSCLPVKTAFKRSSSLKNTELKKSANENYLLEWEKALKIKQKNKNKSINASIVLSKQNNTDSMNEQETENTSSSSILKNLLEKTDEKLKSDDGSKKMQPVGMLNSQDETYEDKIKKFKDDIQKLRSQICEEKFRKIATDDDNNDDLNTISEDDTSSCSVLNECQALTRKILTVKLRKFIEEDWSDSLLDELSTQMKQMKPTVLSQLIITEIQANTLSKLDVSFTPPAPPMTAIQQKVVTLVSYLQDKHNFEELQTTLLSALEKQILGPCITIHNIDKLTRLFVCLCRLRYDLERARLLCCDALYRIGDKAVPVIFTVITCWPEVFPTYENVNGNPMVEVIVHLIYLKKCYSPGYNLNPLRDLLSNFYNYKIGEETSMQIIEKLFEQFKTDKSNNFIYAIMIMTKNLETDFVYKNIIKKYLLPNIVNSFEKDNSKSSDELTAVEKLAVRSLKLMSRILPAFQISKDSSEIDEIKDVLSKFSTKTDLSIQFATQLKNFKKLNW